MKATFVIVTSVALTLTPSLAKRVKNEYGDTANLFCSIACRGTKAKGALSTAMGMSTNAIGDVSTAIGYNTTAGGKSSIAMGVNTRTISDPTVPGGSSCGGCVSMGLGTTTIGDWTTALGSGTTARGYASIAMGEGTVANTFGEVALGLYTELSNHTEEELRNQSVIPTFDEHDVVLRVGIGCPKNLAAGGFGCKAARRLDALRVYKSGALYLKKPNGQMIPDVQAAIEKCHANHEETEQELKMIKQELKMTKQEHETTKQELETIKTMLTAVTARLMELEKPLAQE